MADLRHLPPGTLPPLVLQVGRLVVAGGAGDGLGQGLRPRPSSATRRNTTSATCWRRSQAPRCRRRSAASTARSWSTSTAMRLQARGLTPMDVVHALNRANLIIPAGDAKIGSHRLLRLHQLHDREPGRHQRRAGQGRAGPGAGLMCATSATPRTPPQIQQNIVRIDGQRSVYIPVLKQGGANTISIVNGVEQVLPKITGMPKGMKLQCDLQPGHLHHGRDRRARARSGHRARCSLR